MPFLFCFTVALVVVMLVGLGLTVLLLVKLNPKGYPKVLLCALASMVPVVAFALADRWFGLARMVCG